VYNKKEVENLRICGKMTSSAPFSGIFHLLIILKTVKEEKTDD